MEGRNQDLPSFDFVLRSSQEGDSSTTLTVPEQGRREQSRTVSETKKNSFIFKDSKGQAKVVDPDLAGLDTPNNLFPKRCCEVNHQSL
jgi:hypothetical protein